jgi:hypothetical protein
MNLPEAEMFIRSSYDESNKFEPGTTINLNAYLLNTALPKRFLSLPDIKKSTLNVIQHRS